MYKICCILPYFGKFPNYFDLWMYSCGRNKNVDFLLISDNEQPENLPYNFTYIKQSFEDLKKRIQSVFDFPIRLNAPYKLCDYKPAYGEVFKEELQGYDFWGYIDCDLILGNSKHYLTDEVLSKYDKLYANGHFTLFKNNEIVNKVYRQLDIRKVYSSNYCFNFDEWGGVSAYFKDNPQLTQYEVRDMADIGAGRFRFQHSSPFGTKLQIFEYQSGTLNCIYEDEGRIRRGERFYIHLQKRPMEVCTDSLDSYYICPNKFLSGDSDMEELLDEQRVEKFYWHWYKIRLKQICVNIKNGALRHRFEKLRCRIDAKKC